MIIPRARVKIQSKWKELFFLVLNPFKISFNYISATDEVNGHLKL